MALSPEQIERLRDAGDALARLVVDLEGELQRLLGLGAQSGAVSDRTSGAVREWEAARNSSS